MSLQLGEGFAPYILETIRNIAKQNAPQDKARIPGMLNYLYNQGSKEAVTLNTSDGNRRTVRVAAKQRLTEDFVEDTVASCDVTNVVPSFETDVDVDIEHSINLYLDEETLAKYPASQRERVATGAPTSFDREMYDRILAASNALLTKCDKSLLTKVAAGFGTNVVTGSSAAQAINLEKNTDYNSLTDGETKILTDYQANENVGRPSIVGAGNINAYFMQQGAKSANQAGIDTRYFANQFDFYYDESATTMWGANEFGVFSPNSTQLVEYFEYAGQRGGPRPGASTFFTMPMPSARGNEIAPIKFDVQLKYSDCDQQYTRGYYNDTITLKRGWNLMISKQMGLWTISSQAYRQTDYLVGNTGIYRYSASNDCTTCS